MSQPRRTSARTRADGHGPMAATTPPRPTQRNRAAEWDEWKQRLQDLPDVRWEKILAIRTALKHGTYDVGARLERTVELMQAEIAARSH
jgi:hypothetical protein